MRGVGVLLAAAGIGILVGGCGQGVDPGAGASKEREEIRSGHHYRLRSTVAPRRVTLGDPVRWTLTAELPAAAQPGKVLRGRVPAEIDLEPPKKAESHREGDRVVWSWSYGVRGFTLGKIALPGVLLPVVSNAGRDTLFFPMDTLAVDSLTPAATGIVLPDRGPIDPGLRPLDYAVAAAVLVLLAAVLGLLVHAMRRRRRAAETAAETLEPPDVALRRAVAALRAEGEALPRDRFYERLSLALRDYVARVAGITTRDRTTTEILRDLQIRGDVPREGIEALGRVLVRSDLAKFARRGGAWTEALEVLAAADRLPERLPPPTPAEAAEPGASSEAGRRLERRSAGRRGRP